MDDFDEGVKRKRAPPTNTIDIRLFEDLRAFTGLNRTSVEDRNFLCEFSWLYNSAKRRLYHLVHVCSISAGAAFSLCRSPDGFIG